MRIVYSFFNYNSINRSITIEAVEEHIDALFGKDRADELRSLPLSVEPPDRESSIIKALSQSLKETQVSLVYTFSL